MKLSNAIAGTLLMAGIMMSSANADDKATPDLLEGINPDQIVDLTPVEASDVRGQRIRKKVGYRPGMCGWRPCLKAVYASVDFTYRDHTGRYYYVKH